MRLTDTDTDQAISERVAAEVRAEIARQSLTRAHVATQLGWTQAYLSRRLSGEVAITVGELAVIADVLDVPASRLFPALARAA